jgi:hypothetical protein
MPRISIGALKSCGLAAGFMTLSRVKSPSHC